ncbi:NAD(P)-binding protein [Dothidotthia symphoricarpi CBS 119687]|uniref:NAD(P)-binding protein n=1 Tax=Dothidotthia symphoricarpi CBS 119687 TaxID=1392245 RepID=A0A6A6A8C4_9PLEO|nr:NAD(P)-binding protein [Dothidotthia symphoricarpi CBS 119687]KAF2128222.1 NAD(P)-binding protein [Dothidotthia symphoricarpi CBS 119687]
MTSVIIFGPTGQVGSVAARTAAELGAKVWLAMRDTKKSIPGLTQDIEKTGGFCRIKADLQEPETVSQAVKTSGAKRAFIYLIHGAPDHLKGAIVAMKAAGIELVVFLSSFTIPTNLSLREIPSSDMIPHLHAQAEANLEDTFGSDHYVAVRAGCFITNLLVEKDGIAANDVKLLCGGLFEQDNITPSDIGRVIANILVSGPRNGQNKVYLYGPEVLSMHDSIAKIGKALGKDMTITARSPEETYDKLIGSGIPAASAKHMVDLWSIKGTDKGNGVRWPCYEEGVNNVELYTGKPATSLGDWVEENKAIFSA